MNSYSFFVIIAYLLGAIPCGYILGRIKGVDLRAHGSGNIGATNASRVLGKRLGFITFALDLLKGALAVLLPTLIAKDAFSPLALLDLQPVLALAATLGHCTSPFLKFKGGKGVATAFGSFLIITPVPALLAIILFGMTFKLSRYVSLSSIIAATIFPVLVYIDIYRHYSEITWMMAVLTCALIISRHRENIRRLLAGTENKK